MVVHQDQECQDEADDDGGGGGYVCVLLYLTV